MAPILIAGQGLAGSVLGWAFERAGIDFEIADPGHAEASSRVGAGIINPITGQRIVKSWDVDAQLPFALATYAAMEAAWDVSLVRHLRVRRLFREDAERRILEKKRARGDLDPYLGPCDEAGFWIEGAARVDTAALITAARRHWRTAGRLREERVDVAAALERRSLVILCHGAGVLHAEGAGGGLPWIGARGEILNLTAPGIDDGVIVNQGHWLLPVGGAAAKVGATYSRLDDVEPVLDGRAALVTSAQALLAGRAWAEGPVETGIRVATPDKHPIVGRDGAEPRIGYCNGLGSKGALLMPGLARQWVNHLTEGVPFASAVDAARFRRPGSEA